MKQNEWIPNRVLVEKFIRNTSLPVWKVYQIVMSTSVKLSRVDKEKLERLQALITLKTGGKVTQQELLSMLIDEAMLNGDEFVKKVSKPSLPISDDEYERILSLVDDWGVETTWEEVDRVLYGEKRSRRR